MMNKSCSLTLISYAPSPLLNEDKYLILILLFILVGVPKHELFKLCPPDEEDTEKISKPLWDKFKKICSMDEIPQHWKQLYVKFFVYND
jgi:hypothetical protein